MGVIATEITATWKEQPHHVTKFVAHYQPIEYYEYSLNKASNYFVTYVLVLNSIFPIRKH